MLLVGEHRTCSDPLHCFFTRTGWKIDTTIDEAQDACARVITGDPVTPLHNNGIWKMRLVFDGEAIEEHLAVRPLPRVV